MPRRPAKKALKALPEKRIYFTLAVEAIKTLADPTGTSQPAIEKYIAATYQDFNFKRHLLRSAIKRALAKGDILVHHNHKNSYKLPPKSPSKVCVVVVRARARACVCVCVCVQVSE